MFFLDIELRRAYAGRRFLGGGTLPPTRCYWENTRSWSWMCPWQTTWKSYGEPVSLSGGFPTVLRSWRWQGRTAIELLYLLELLVDIAVPADVKICELPGCRHEEKLKIRSTSWRPTAPKPGRSRRSCKIECESEADLHRSAQNWVEYYTDTKSLADRVVYDVCTTRM